MQREIKVRAFGEFLIITRCAGGWQTTDGRVFARPVDAARHEIELLVINSGDDTCDWENYIEAAAHTAVRRADAACC